MKCVCGHEMTCHEYKNQWVCHRCGRTKRIKITNFDVIKESMDICELAELLSRDCCHITGGDNQYCDGDCESCVREWLESEAEE